MKTLPAGLQEHLDSGATTMCYCWRITRKDATVMGFTDHDLDLTFDGTTYEAATGFTASAAQQSMGLSVDNLDLTGGVNSTAITEDDIAAGRYDDAFVEIFWVNWQNVAQRVIQITGYFGEVTLNGGQYTAELRSLATRLNQKIGRVYQRTCDAVFGDNRCKFDIATVTFVGTVVSAPSPRTLVMSGLNAHDNDESDYFSRGVLAWIDGPNAGVKYDIKSYARISDTEATIELWTPCTEVPQPGDTSNVSAGCLQTAAVCASKFDNIANFQGFPTMPGNDIITSYPSPGGSNQTGGSRVS